MGKKRRASAAQAARNENYHERHGNGMKKRRLAREEATDRVVADNFDDVFRYEDRDFGFSQEHVNKVAAANWECDPALLPVDTFAPAFTLFNPHDRTEPLAVRFVDIVRKSSETKLIGAYHELVTPIEGMKGKYKGVPKHSSKKTDANRASDSGAWHLGYWETTANQPRITAESKAPLQNSRQIRKIHNLLFHVKEYAVRPLQNAIKRYFPAQWEWRQICTDRARAILMHTFKEHPCLDLGDGFHAIAIKDGSSDRLHVDVHDGIMAWIIVLGQWEDEGYLVIPQLGMKFRIPPRSAFGFLASRLAHFTTLPTGGERIVITCFTDRFLLKHACEDLGLTVPL